MTRPHTIPASRQTRLCAVPGCTTRFYGPGVVCYDCEAWLCYQTTRYEANEPFSEGKPWNSRPSILALCRERATEIKFSAAFSKDNDQVVRLLAAAQRLKDWSDAYGGWQTIDPSTPVFVDPDECPMADCDVKFNNAGMLCHLCARWSTYLAVRDQKYPDFDRKPLSRPAAIHGAQQKIMNMMLAMLTETLGDSDRRKRMLRAADKLRMFIQVYSGVAMGGQTPTRILSPSLYRRLTSEAPL